MKFVIASNYISFVVASDHLFVFFGECFNLNFDVVFNLYCGDFEFADAF